MKKSYKTKFKKILKMYVNQILTIVFSLALIYFVIFLASKVTKFIYK